MSAGPVQPAGEADDGQGGFALVMVLLFLLTVSALITPMVLGARTEFLVAANKLQQERMEMLAQGVLTVLARELAAPPLQPRSAGITVRSMPARCASGGMTVEARIQDQWGLIDLNAAEEGLLEAGFVALGLDRGPAAALARAAVAFRTPPEEGGVRPGANPATVVAGFKEAPFEAVEELYDFNGLRRVPARAVAEVFTVHNTRETIVGPRMSQRLSQLLPAAPTPRYPFIIPEEPEGEKTYRIEVEVGSMGAGTSGFAGAVVLASENEAGDFAIVERVSNPEFLPGEETVFSAATDCDRLFGIGVAAALAAIQG